jgi:hypothetical protein
MSRPWYIDFFRSRTRRSTLGVAKQIILPEPQRPSGPSVFWELRTIIAALGFAGSNWKLHRWWRSTEEAHVGPALERAGLDTTDVRVSLKCAQARAKEENEQPPDAGFFMQEYVASTEGMVVLLCRWAATGAQERRASAHAVLYDIIAYTIADKAADHVEGLGVPAGNGSHCCSRPSQHPSYPCQHCADVAKKLGNPADYVTANSQWQYQALLLITLWSSTAACHAMGSWFARVLHTASHALNIAILSGEVGQPTPERLPQPMGARKRRRLDPELRNSFKAAVAEKRARNAQWHARGGSLDLPSRTAGSLGETLAADYYWSSFKLLTGCDQLSVCLDASSVGGEDTMVLAAWSWQAGKGCWLVPQAA